MPDNHLPARAAAPKASKPSSPGLAASTEERLDHRVWIGGAVKTLLSIYGDWPADVRLQAAWGKAWADDLEWFPQRVIEAALVAWRRSEATRPTPADIIRLCRAEMPAPAPVSALPRPDRPLIDAEARARNLAMMQEAFPELRRVPTGAGS